MPATYTDRDDAVAAMPAYVVTREEAAQIAKLQDSIEFWNRKAAWNGDDGFSLSEWLAPVAAADCAKEIDLIASGGFAAFLVLVDAASGAVLATRPELMPAYGQPWRDESKWVVRGADGRMTRDASGRWAVYPTNPARESTLAKRGVAERWIVARGRLVGRDESIGEAMRRGTAQSQKLLRVDRERLATA